MLASTELSVTKAEISQTFAELIRHRDSKIQRSAKYTVDPKAFVRASFKSGPQLDYAAIVYSYALNTLTENVCTVYMADIFYSGDGWGLLTSSKGTNEATCSFVI